MTDGGDGDSAAALESTDAASATAAAMRRFFASDVARAVVVRASSSRNLLHEFDGRPRSFGCPTHSTSTLALRFIFLRVDTSSVCNGAIEQPLCQSQIITFLCYVWGVYCT